MQGGRQDRRRRRNAQVRLAIPERSGPVAQPFRMSSSWKCQMVTIGELCSCWKASAVSSWRLRRRREQAPAHSRASRRSGPCTAQRPVALGSCAAAVSSPDRVAGRQGLSRDQSQPARSPERGSYSALRTTCGGGGRRLRPRYLRPAPPAPRACTVPAHCGPARPRPTCKTGERAPFSGSVLAAHPCPASRATGVSGW